MKNVSGVYVAEYFNDSNGDFEEITQFFQGSSYGNIEHEYFSIYGDLLGRLTAANGEVVYDNMDDVEEQVAYDRGFLS